MIYVGYKSFQIETPSEGQHVITETFNDLQIKVVMDDQERTWLVDMLCLACREQRKMGFLGKFYGKN